MRSFNETLNELLKKDSRFIDENNELIRAEIINEALKIDKELISLLISNKETKEKFFSEIKGYWIFEMNKFIDYIQDKNFLNDSYTKYKNKIGLSIGDKLLKERREVALSFPFKDCILEGGQTKEEDKRKEIFFNVILAQDEIDRLLEPKVLTNFKRYTPNGEEKVTEIKRNEKGIIRENLIIKGNNLLAMHSIKKQFYGKVKLIYIDPPYNTGSDSFGYNDNFNHSTWLTFMKNRLEVAKELLRNDGLIFVQCDDKEQGYLKLLLDEIFNRENYQSTFYVQVRYPDKQLATAMDFHKLIETIFVYSKSNDPKIYRETKEYDYSKYVWEIKEGKPFKKIKLGNYEVDLFNKDNFKIIEHKENNNKLLKEIWASGKILSSSSTGRFFRDFLTGRFKDDGYGVLYRVWGIGEGKSGFRYITGPKKEGATKGKYYQEIPLSKLDKDYGGEVQPISNFYDMAGDFGNCRHEGKVELRGGKKPEILIKQLIEMSTEKGDIVLDYHLGSGTTGAVAHKMDRQYIGIEQLNYEENGSVTRLKNVIGKEKSKGKISPIVEDYDNTGISEAVNWKGGGDFIYCELARYNSDFIEKIYKAKDTKELLKIWKEMKEKSFIDYNVDVKTAEEHIGEFKQLPANKQKEILISILNKNQLYINLSEIEDSYFKISKEDKELNKKFYG